MWSLCVSVFRSLIIPGTLAHASYTGSFVFGLPTEVHAARSRFVCSGNTLPADAGDMDVVCSLMAGSLSRLKTTTTVLFTVCYCSTLPTVRGIPS